MKTPMPRRDTPKQRDRTSRRAATIDDYLRGLDSGTRAVLEQLRRIIMELRPDAEECISYAMPAFRVNGIVVAGFAATTKGCSYFPFSGTTLRTLAGDLKGFGKTKSALHFTPEKPLPKALVRQLIKARIAETGR